MSYTVTVTFGANDTADVIETFETLGGALRYALARDKWDEALCVAVRLAVDGQPGRDPTEVYGLLVDAAQLGGVVGQAARTELRQLA